MDHVPPQHQHDAVDADRLGGADDALAIGSAKRVLLPALALLAALTSLALGVWQLERLAWKTELIARVEARLRVPPRPLPPASAWPRLTERKAAYRRVRVPGVLLHERETLVRAVTARGAGFWVMTPLRALDQIVLVNRGFVPPALRDPAARPRGQVRGRVTITGLVRMSEPGGGFLRANDPAADRWYSRDVAAIARARRLGPVAPFFVDADAAANPGGHPVGGLTVVAFPNTHLVYALTWFALAALCAAAFARMLRSGRAGG
ncbi:MAG: SURF1 family protein [Novosphingobium sp.]